jgi:hypothetical protein
LTGLAAKAAVAKTAASITAPTTNSHFFLMFKVLLQKIFTFINIDILNVFLVPFINNMIPVQNRRFENHGIKPLSPRTKVVDSNPPMF